MGIAKPAMLGAVIFAAGLAGGCDPNGYALVTLRFDCSINPLLVRRVILYVEPEDDGELEGLTQSSSFVDDVLVRGQDIDADGRLEYVLVVFSDRFKLREGVTVRIASRRTSARLRMRAIVGDFNDRQIGQGPDSGDGFVRLRLERGEESQVDVEVGCLCRGLSACAGTCKDLPQSCGPDEPAPLDERMERFCGDDLNDLDDEIKDCGDEECRPLAGCAHCEPEDCDDRTDNDCDGRPDCNDPDCRLHPACRGCLAEEDCSSRDDCQSGDDDCNDDEDCDGSVDCADLDCRNYSRCQQCPEVRPEVCDNAEDDDCDGFIDCRDEGDCATEAPEHEVGHACSNDFDDDCDGLADCNDPDCADDPECPECHVPEDCTNRVDDNCDGLADCEEQTCIEEARGLNESGVAWCTDLGDNDCDGWTDCEDADCDGIPVTEVCDDGVDNDCDDAIDCGDPDCSPARLAGVVEVACSDGVDNDCDGLTDCEDTDDCSPSVEICNDSRDNDCDAHFDCSDWENCWSSPFCVGCEPEQCSDGVDNDCDHLPDCFDADCASPVGPCR